MEKTKDVIIKLLEGTKRDGINKLIEWLEDEGFFECPASTRFHGAHPGGLMVHSLNVYQNLTSLIDLEDLNIANRPGQKPLAFTPPNLIIAGLLHDVCKVGAYIGDKAPYKWNKQQPQGHAILSIKRIKHFIKLEPIEDMMIRYHMGPYGCYEFYEEGSWEYKANAEYPMRGDHSKDDKLSKEASQKARYGKSLRNAWYHNPIVKLMYFCDELAVMQEKSYETQQA